MGRSSGSGTGAGGGSVRDPDQLKRYLENVPAIAERSFYPSLGVRNNWFDKTLSTAQVEGSVRDLGNQVFSYLQQRGFTPDTAQFNQAMQDTKSQIFLPPKENGGYDRKYLNRLQSVRQPGVSEGEWDKRLSDIYFGRDKTPNAEWVKGFMGEVDSAVQKIPDNAGVQERRSVRSQNQKSTIEELRRIEQDKGHIGKMFDPEYLGTALGAIGRTLADTPSALADDLKRIPGVGDFLFGKGPTPGTPPPPIQTTPQPHPSQQDFRQRRNDEMQMFQQQLQGKGRAELFSMINTFPRGSQERDMILYMINAQLLNEAAGVFGQ